MKYYLLILISFVFYGCTSNLEDKIRRIADKKCTGEADSCFTTIRLVELTDIKWDRFYFFEFWVSLDEINSTLGRHYPYWGDLSSNMVFLYKDSIVYHEDHLLPDPEEHDEKSVMFNLRKRKYYTPENATFRLSLHHYNRKKYYYVDAL